MEDQSQLTILAGTQTADTFGFYASVNSSVVADTGSVLLGPVQLFQFSNLSLLGGSTITGDLQCFQAANAWCQNPSMVSGATMGCSACVKP